MAHAPLLVVTGPDGAGKSSLSRTLVQEVLPALGFRQPRQISLWQSLRQSGLGSNKNSLYAYLASLRPHARSLLIMHGLQQAWDTACADPGADVLIYDGFWYKYWVSELALGADASFWQSFVQTLPRPQLSLLLTVSPVLAYERKHQTGISSYECGLARPDRHNFLCFQESLRPYWQLCQRLQGPWLSLDSELCSLEELSTYVAAYLRTHLRRLPSKLGFSAPTGPMELNDERTPLSHRPFGEPSGQSWAWPPLMDPLAKGVGHAPSPAHAAMGR